MSRGALGISHSWKPRLQLRCFPGREGSGQERRPLEVMGTADAKAGRAEKAQDVCTAAGSAWLDHRMH